MANKPVVIDLPEELFDRVQAAHLDLNQFVIEALERKLPTDPNDDGIRPSLAEIEANIRESMEFVKNADPSQLRILGLHADNKSWFSDDWIDPLPDEFWFGDEDNQAKK